MEARALPAQPPLTKPGNQTTAIPEDSEVPVKSNGGKILAGNSETQSRGSSPFAPPRPPGPPGSPWFGSRVCSSAADPKVLHLFLSVAHHHLDRARDQLLEEVRREPAVRLEV